MEINKLPSGHRVRTTEHLTQYEGGSDPWHELGRAVLRFHHRITLTADCRCGRTVIDCDVLEAARRLGLLPPLE